MGSMAKAFELREHFWRGGRKVADIAAALVASHALLSEVPKQAEATFGSERRVPSGVSAPAQLGAGADASPDDA